MAMRIAGAMVKLRGRIMNSNTRAHGSPYDRGSADSYYGRPLSPHWWPNGTNKGYRIEQGLLMLLMMLPVILTKLN
jgi:hypothetical protein